MERKLTLISYVSRYSELNILIVILKGQLVFTLIRAVLISHCVEVCKMQNSLKPNYILSFTMKASTS